MSAPTLDPEDLTARLTAAGLAAGFRLERYGEVSGHPLFALTRRTPGPRPRIYLSSGVHGDEPAPVLATLRLLERGSCDDRAHWFLCPLVNPTGFVAGTRESAAGVDLNRDYHAPEAPESRAHLAWLARQPRFDLTICLHEDWEAHGAYLFEHNLTRGPSLAPAMLAAAAAAGCPVDPGALIDGHQAVAGVVDGENPPWSSPKWPEAIYLCREHTRLSYTLETPSGFPLETRISAQVAAVEAGIAAAISGAAARR